MRILKLFLLFFIFVNCNQNNKIDEEFYNFDKRFHSDSILQMSRITFPLKGNIVDGFEKKNWSEKEWQILKHSVTEKIEEKDFKKQTSFSDSLVTERIWIENSGFSFERHFKKINGKWFLVYCEDKNL